MLQGVNGWMYPPKPKYVSQELKFIVSVQHDVVLTYDTGERHYWRYLRAGIEYPIAGIRREESTGYWQVMLVDTSVVTFNDPDTFTIICETVGNSWGGTHDEPYDVNKRNVKSRRDAIKKREGSYGFYTSVHRDSSPSFYVPIRQYRHQPNQVMGENVGLVNPDLLM